MELGSYEINRTCRTCRSETLEMRSLFDGYEMLSESPRIDEMLMACTAVQVRVQDGLPNLICTHCTEQLKIAYCFKQQCVQSDMYFKECLRNVNARTTNMKSESIKEEIQNAEAALTDSCTEATASNDSKQFNSTQRSDYIEFMESNQMILTCRECGKVFTTLDGLRSHKRIHLGTLFKCRFCGKGYTRQTHVYRHELSHGKHKVHVCRICNKTLTRMEHLRRHLTTHLKEKPFHCKSCNRGFNRIDHLDAHALRCKGDRVHICDICNRGFSRLDSMEVHKKMHENQKPVLPTLDNIDNIDEHYFEIDFDPNRDDSVTICSVGSDVEDLLEPQVEVNENIEEEEEDEDEEIKGIADLNTEEKVFDESLVNNECIANTDNTENNENTEPNNVSNDNELNERLSTASTMNDPVEEAFDLYQEAPEGTNDVADNDSDSVHSEYLPTKTKKKGRGRPRKFPKAAKPRGRPKKTEIKREVEDDEEDEFSCNFCTVTFKKMSHLDKHIRRTHDSVKEYNCNYCAKTFSRYNHYKRHLASHQTVKPFTCDTCGKGFIRRDHLRQHVKLHEKKLEYECDECGKKFNRADQLAKHKVSKHSSPDANSGEKKFECEVCRKSFTTEKYRDVHFKGHLGEKRHQCKTCQKCFLSKSHLTEHMKFHNDHSKKFLCSECGQRFIRNDYLVIHMRRHRGEKPFKCKFCGKGFPRTTDLTVHERYHTGEKTHLCTICGRGFGRAYNLTVHMRTHTGEKPYRCTYCDAAFAQGNDLKAHVRRHTGERFQCELCSENFLMGYLLTQHKRTIHGLNVVSNIRRLQPLDKIKHDADEPPPITISLPKPIIPDAVFTNISAHLAAQIQNHHLAPLTQQ